MDKTKEKTMQDMVTDTLLSIPKPFSIDGRCFYIYPATLGTMQLMARMLNGAGINSNVLNSDTTLELLRLARQKPEYVARILAIRCCKGKDEICSNTLREYVDYFTHISEENMAVLLEMILQPDNVAEIIHYLNIDREQRAMQAAIRAKKDDGNSVNTGGVSLYGGLIDAACERYGWTFDYVVWGISYANLQLLLADRPQQVYLTDKERRHAVIPPHGRNIRRVENLTKEDIIAMTNKQKGN